MIVALSLPALLIAAPVPESAGLDVLQDRSFDLMGWYCSGAGCEQVPRQFDASIIFSAKNHEKILDSAKHESFSWSATLDCIVSRDRLESCKLVDGKSGPTAGSDVAISLAQTVRLNAENSPRTRAIVAINYEIGGCPSWFCVAHPYGLVGG